jgi:organic radical activating enzyme
MKTLKMFLNEIQEGKKKIICFGTGLMAEEALQYSQIRHALICMMDNDKMKQGVEYKLCGQYYPVIDPEKVDLYLDENTVILLTSGYYKDMHHQLEEMSLTVQPEIYAFAELQAAYMSLSEEFFEERFLKECLKEYEIVLEQYNIDGEEKIQKMKEKESFIKGKGKSDRPFVVPRIMIMPTTRCNMSCIGCSSLLPLFKTPKDVELKQILKDFELFFSGIDECIRITVGGEPFLYPHLTEILRYLLQQKKVLGIMLITNSTILPKPEIIELLKEQKILLEISDYGHLEKMSRLIQLLEKNNICFKVLTDQFWTDMGGVECRGRTDKELRLQYLNCNQGKVIKGFHNGKFHICARSARMLSLGAYESDKDYFELDEKDSSEIIRKKLMKLFYSESADACNYCDLGILPTKVIEAGVQMNGKVKKSRYTIVDRQEYEELKRAARIGR